MHCCKKCSKICAVLFLVLGLLFLARDLQLWTFFGLQWWTALFLLMGFVGLGASGCPDCQAVMGGSSVSKRRR